jgi:hypothetical protein
MVVSSLLLITEVVVETFSYGGCPLELVLGSPLLPLHVLPVGSQPICAW